MTVGYRKLISMAVLVAVIIAVEVFGGRLSSEALDTLRWLYGSFAGANAAEHLASALKK